MGHDIFIVHGAPDKPRALKLREALQRLGIDVFVDATETKSGTPWDETIDRALRESLLQVVLVGATKRWYQHEEIDIAIKQMRKLGATDRVIPVVMKAGQDLPYGINRVQALVWDGADATAMQLAAKVKELRGGSSAGAQRKIRAAVIGVREELGEHLETLRKRIGQRTAILDGEVQLVDIATQSLPAVDLRMVLLGSRHAGKIEQLKELCADAERTDADRTTIVGALEVPPRKVAAAYRREVVDVQFLPVSIASNEIENVIDAIAEQVTTWYATRFPARPGMSIAREPWEERYLQDKVPLWRKGDPSAMRTQAGARVDRVRWYVHLKAAEPWVEVGGDIRYRVRTVFALKKPGTIQWTPDPEALKEPGLPDEQTWWGTVPNAQPGHKQDPHDNSPAFRHHDATPQPAWLDPVLSHRLLPRCVVVGLAGTGKTVLLQHLAWVIASGATAGPDDDPVHRVDRSGIRGDSPTDPIPILHTATTLVTHLHGRPIREALVALLRSSDTFGDGADPAALRAGIDSGRYLFLFDSLDEVPASKDREAVVAALGTLRGPCRVVLTTRPSAYTAVELPDGFARVDIAPLDETSVARLTRAWVSSWAPGEDLREIMAAVERVRRDFPTTTDELAPVENPLLLTCVLLVYTIYRALPDDTARLYSDMVRVLCEAKLRSADDRDRDTVVERYREALRALSFATQEIGGTRLQLTAALELLFEKGFDRRNTVENWLHGLANHTALVRFEGSGKKAVIRPWHRSFQEYLAAEEIAVRYANRAVECVAWLLEARPNRGARLSDPTWRGTLRFLVGASAHQNRAWGVRLIEELSAAAQRSPGHDQARLFAFGVEGAAEYANTLFEHEPLRESLPTAFTEAFATDGVRWPVNDRLDALDALGRLGDPRLSDPRQRRNDPDPGWVEVSAGTYATGSTEIPKKDPGRRKGKTRKIGKTGSRVLPRADHTIAGFWIRRWPVTVAEFLFYANSVKDEHWKATQWATRMHLEMRSTWENLARFPSRPMVLVDWFVARDFCRWAQANWQLPIGGVIDLPTSTEWEIAARRHTDRTFPWGDDEPGTGNGAAAAHAWDNAQLARQGPTPVGAFPRGHTPEGLWDMAGNAFEWCASLNHGFADEDLPIEETGSVEETGMLAGEMVYRGGSWSRSAETLRVVRRGDHHPRALDQTTGFRVVCRPRRATTKRP